MKKPGLTVTITKEETGYSAVARIDEDFIGTEGETFEELKSNLLEAVNLACERKQIVHTLEEIDFTFDLQSFFDFYRVINAKALSERIGMNQSLLAQYISGKKNPSPEQLNRILTGVHQIGRELSEISFISF